MPIDPVAGHQCGQFGLGKRTGEGVCGRVAAAIALAKGKLRGKQPKLSVKQQKELRRMPDGCDHSISDLAELFSISRPTIYRTLSRVQVAVVKPTQRNLYSASMG